MEEKDYIKLFDTNELNRLQRCAKNKDKKEILKWGQDFERRLSDLYYKRYKDYYLKEYAERLKDIDVAIIYALHFNNKTKFGNQRLLEFMNELAISLKGFYNDGFNRQDYIQMLKDDNINILGDW